MELTPSRRRSQSLHVETIFIENQDPVYVTQAVGNAVDGDVPLLKLQLAAQRRIGDNAANSNRKHELAAGDVVGINRVRDRHVDAAARVEV